MIATIGQSVRRLQQLQEQRINEVLRPYGLAQSQWYVLLLLVHGGVLTQKELQTTLQVEAATLTTLVDALERKQLLVRTPSQQDRRIKQLQLTPAGQELWRTLPDPAKIVRSRMLKNISSAEENITREILAKAIQNLEQQ